MPTFAKSPPELVALFDRVAPGPPAVRKQMFGYPAAFVNGNMVMGLHEARFIVRLGTADRAALLDVAGATTFEPMPGRAMKEYVVVPESILRDEPRLREWASKAVTYGLALPPKAAKPPKAARTPKRAAVR